MVEGGDYGKELCKADEKPRTEKISSSFKIILLFSQILPCKTTFLSRNSCNAALRDMINKFAEELGHRDYLGAVMNLGMERDVIGDILIRDKSAYMFCMDNIAGYIQANLEKIRHTSVKVFPEKGEIDALSPRL